jgi:hypothetical protein
MTISSITNTPSFVFTYDNLTSTIYQYLERNDTAVVNQVPVAISLCEYEIAQQIKTLGQLNVAESTLTAGNPVVAKPARWRKTVSMKYTDASGNKQPIYLRKYEYLTAYWPNNTNTAPPIYYADYDYDHWYLSPTPDQSYAFEVLFYERILPLSSTNQTNWLTQNAPNALLFGTLLQMTPFLKNDTRIPTWQQMYQNALNMLKSEDITRVGDRQTVVQDS